MTNEEAIKQMIDMLAYYTTLNANHRDDPLFDVVNNRKDMIALSMAIKALEQEPKTGYWYYDEEREATGIYAICSNCDEEIYQTGVFKYCPNCGCRMVEPQESEG